MRKPIESWGMTDPGKVRSTNQDQFLIADLVKTLRIDNTSLHLDSHRRLSGDSQGKLLLVADGMGGHSAGERASELALTTINKYVLNTMHWLFRLDAGREQDFESELKAALESCDKQIREEAALVPDERGMGTTVTMAYVIWPRMYVVHVGDSRCYIHRNSQIQQITTDHTYAEQLVEAGMLTPEKAESSNWSHVLWNVVGGSDSTIQPMVYKCELAKGDTILLCTDGLTRHVSDNELAMKLDSKASAKETCERLVAAANAAGGRDNITAIVARTF